MSHRCFLLNEGHLSKRRSFQKFIILTALTFVGGLIFTMTAKDGNEGKKVSPVFKAFHDCVRPNLEHLKGNYEQFWHSFTSLTEGCDDLEAYKALDIRTVENQDETKYVAFPHRDKRLTMVTLGIGHDVNAEIKLKELYPNIEFFGADPASDINKYLYVNTLGGKYVQYAVSGTNRLQKSRVYTSKLRTHLKKGRSIFAFCHEQNVHIFPEEKSEEEMTIHIAVDYFLKYFLFKHRIDILWIDIGQNEYPILEQLHNDGLIERKGVKICQINVELHKDLIEPKSGAEIMKFHDFVWKLLEDKKYIMMKPYYVKGFSFIRTFIVNVSDKECTDLYLK
ncbi:hypothetical protein B9Z55_018288 [Caenorhabditis nigoni]|uniref:Methyltransferase FkbM domain-containing protein n=1 Tax=Caenorhabditis nigoni TaxID=1611254 RepID=A0A2G5TDK4_9PELO|nr:hypothetical protein B9Z55_018288 [Caenorhabditis nigoni]